MRAVDDGGPCGSWTKLQPGQGPASRPMSVVPYLSRRWPRWRHGNVTRHGARGAVTMWRGTVHAERWHCWRRSDCRRSSMRHPVDWETVVLGCLLWILLCHETVSLDWLRASIIISSYTTTTHPHNMELLLRTNFDIPKPPGGVFDREYSHFFYLSNLLLPMSADSGKKVCFEGCSAWYYELGHYQIELFQYIHPSGIWIDHFKTL